MCGISGIIYRPGERPDVALVTAMAHDMIHRGPDAQTTFVHEHFAFAHRRLKVIDVSEEADQPIFNEQSDVAVVFNGEIYNFRELRTELEHYGHKFKTRSDTEVIVHAYEEWGTAAFSRFNGMFAFALWDGRGADPVFYLVRDKNGIKPLFYAELNGRIGFSSELKPLMRLPWVSKEVSAHTLYNFLQFSHVPHPLSILRDVMQLEPGHFMKITAAGSETHSFAQYQRWNAARNSLTESEWEERFASCLRSVVRRQIVSDVPVGCFLSGGVDSSLLAMAFSAQAGHRVKTFSVGYAEAEFDERSHARAVANEFGTDHHELLIGAGDVKALVPDIPRFFDQPFADPSLLPTMMLCRFARSQVTVALSGDGGDEIFWGYDYQRILRNLRPLLATPAVLRRGLLDPLVGPAAHFSDRARKFLEILQFKNEAELFQYFVGMIGPLRLDRIADLVKDQGSPGTPFFSPLVQRAKALSWEEKIAYVFQNTFLVDTVLAKSDRASMAYGLEARVPFLDDEMQEFARELPFRMKYRPHRSKFLLREVLGKNLPPEIANRKKQGFGVPISKWLRGELRYLVDDFVLGDSGKLGEWLNMEQVRPLAHAHLAGERNHSHLLWSLICLGLWKERYINP